MPLQLRRLVDEALMLSNEPFIREINRLNRIIFKQEVSKRMNNDALTKEKRMTIDYGPNPCVERDDNGEWIRFDDVASAVKMLRDNMHIYAHDVETMINLNSIIDECFPAFNQQSSKGIKCKDYKTNSKNA